MADNDMHDDWTRKANHTTIQMEEYANMIPLGVGTVSDRAKRNTVRPFNHGMTYIELFELFSGWAWQKCRVQVGNTPI